MLKTQTGYKWKQLYYIISKKNGILKKYGILKKHGIFEKTRNFEKTYIH